MESGGMGKILPLYGIENKHSQKNQNRKKMKHTNKNKNDLGYGLSMDYVADKAHLEWKIRQLSSVLSVDIPNYRKGIEIAREIESSERS